MCRTGVNNGVVEAWLDGQQMVLATGLNYRNTTDTQIDWIYFSSFFGGKGADWAPPTDVVRPDHYCANNCILCLHAFDANKSRLLSSCPAASIKLMLPTYRPARQTCHSSCLLLP
jgi:hypothetical protein